MAAGFGLVVRFTLRNADAARDFDELVARTLEGIRDCEHGTVVYMNHRVPGEPDARIFYELYKDRAAFEAHERQPHTRHFLEERERFVSEFEVTFLERIDGKA
ncbi:antibiotic biosynthesis monooxygenase [Streptomyces griseocarneus]|nr:antibiotic biosynthesis monooxygenase [Streptomyces griseocarneus]